MIVKKKDSPYIYFYKKSLNYACPQSRSNVIAVRFTDNQPFYSINKII